MTKKVNQDNLLLIPVHPAGKQKQWFVNYQGFKALTVYFDNCSSHAIEKVFGDLYRKTMDGHATTQTRHPYKFTHEDMNAIFYEVSKIGRVKLQNTIYELLRGGLK